MLKSINSKTLIGTLAGNIMEFYDFTVYAFLSSQISQAFFPNNTKVVALLLSFSIFATGYITRPLGAMFFGYIGDKFGRKPALKYSILLATAASVLIGILPGYATLGITAPTVLIMLRLIQGFAVSGEEGGAAVYLSEACHGKNIGLIGSLVISSIFLGIILASTVCYLVSILITTDEMYSWGWRIPFILSLPLGIISYLIRDNLDESPAFVANSANINKVKNPCYNLLSKQKAKVVSLIFIGAAYSISTCVCVVYLPHYYTNVLNVGLSQALGLTTVCLIMVMLITPLIGKLSDRTGHVKLFTIASLTLATTAYPIFDMIKSVDNAYILYAGQFFLSLVIGSIAAPFFAILNETFPTNIRYTGVSFVFNTTISIFSSTTPIAIIFLSNYLASPVSAYLVFAGTAGVTGCYFANKSLCQHSLLSAEV